MKENVFRAWDKSKKIMVYSGDLYSQFNYNKYELTQKVYPCLVTSHGIVYNNRISKEDANNYVELVKDGKHMTYYCNWEYEQLYNHNIEIMQYTGIKDNHDKKIYEGDIVQEDGDDFSYLIEFKDCEIIAKKIRKPNGDIYTKHNKNLSCLWDLKVIGNIYQNPELLEVK